MRILIHAGSLSGAGSSYIGRRIIESLASSDNELKCFVPSEWAETLLFHPRSQVAQSRRGLLSKFATEVYSIPKQIISWQADRLLSLTDTTTPIPSVPHLLFVQQAFLAYSVRDLDFRLPITLRLKISLMEAYFRLGQRGVTQFAVQTPLMKRKLIDRWRLAEGRVVVIPSTVDPPVALDDAGRENFIFYPALGHPYKNHEILGETMRLLLRDHPGLRCKLTVTRSEVPGLVREAAGRRVLHAFDFLGPRPRTEVLQHLRQARCVIFPSRLESLGLPLMEAMAHRTPIVVSDREWARETAGEGALYADPDDGYYLAGQVDRVLADDLFVRKLTECAYSRWASQPTWNEIGRMFQTTLAHL